MERWDEVDHFIEDHLVPQDDALRTAAGGIGVSAPQGKLLHLLARSIGARRILELGTLHGYSAIWLARALPADGELITLELDPDTAATARANVDRAGVGERVDIRVGPALESLPGVDGPFDLAFLDADKAGMPDYFAAVVPLVRTGGLIIGDNTVRAGAVIDGEDPSAVGARRFHEVVASSPDVEATGLQTVGTKGHDGFVLALKVT